MLSIALNSYGQDTSAYYYRQLGMANVESAPRESIAWLSKAIALSPPDFNLYFYRATAKANYEDYVGAIADFNIAIEMNKEVLIIVGNRGKAKAKLQDFRGAIVDYNYVISNNPKAGYYDERGDAKAKLKDYVGAIADYNIAIEMQPWREIYYFSRGLAKIAINDKNGGCLDLSKAGELGYSKAYEMIKYICQ